MSVNKLIGEIEIEIGEKKFVLTPTFDGLCEMELRAGCGVSALSVRAVAKTLGINDITAIVYGGICGRAGFGNAPSIEYHELGRAILKHGVIKLINPITDFLTYALTGEISEEDIKKKGQISV